MQQTVAIGSKASRKRETVAALKSRISELERFDALTGLPNRSVLIQRLEEEASVPSPAGAVLIIDIDNFRSVADAYGFMVADALIAETAPQLAACLREGDFIGRVGGDEFGALLPGCAEPEAVIGIAERLLNRFSAPWSVGGLDFFLTASIGIAFLGPGINAQKLLQNASTALYEAKRNGRNRYEIHAQDSHDRLLNGFRFENEFRTALGRGEIFVEHQPQIDIGSGEVIGFEALARWLKADGTRVPPDRFIPLAEDSGLIGSMGKRIIEQVCASAADWRDRGFAPVRTAINVSARQLQDKDFAPSLRRTLDRWSLSPEWIEIEITESNLVRSFRAAAGTLETLRDMGITIAMDDFGTGYSSLSYLKNLPLDKIKIDKSFVADIGLDARSEAVIHAVIVLAQKMDLEVLAEGVETAAQAFFLKTCGCSRIQGFLLGRPMDASAAAALVARGKVPLPWDEDGYAI